MGFILPILVSFVLAVKVVSWPENAKDILQNAFGPLDAQLKRIHERWDIDHFPGFLSTVNMNHFGWEVMKVKFEDKILKSLDRILGKKFVTESEPTFILSFMGTSVTAAHDSPMNKGFPHHTGENLEGVFRALGIKMESRSGGVGNNPCVPYDLCPSAYAGPDADIIVLEQSFNCFFGEGESHFHEKMIRLMMRMPNQPILAVADSLSPNWGADACKDKPTEPTPLDDKEKKYLEALKNVETYKSIPTELNAAANQLGDLVGFQKMYKPAGIQMWFHQYYNDERYRCRGPYVKDWGCCSASWHPSLLGHELRADNHAYMYLLILKDAVTNLKKLFEEGGTLESITKKIQDHQTKEHKFLPQQPMHNSTWSDSLKCITAWTPSFDKNSQLPLMILPSKVDKRPPFKFNSFDAVMHQEKSLFDEDLFGKNKKMGYTDVKWMYYGNVDSAPLSMKAQVDEEGYGFLCEPTGWYGDIPKSFKRLSNPEFKFFLTKNVPVYEEFEFDQSKAEEISFFMAMATGVLEKDDPKNGQNLCVQSTNKLPKGRHVITILSPTKDFVFLSTVLLP